MAKKNFSEFLYNVENIVDELMIGFLSLGFLIVTAWAFLVKAGEVDMLKFGTKVIDPWITPLALMIIARELWLMRRQRGE